MARNFELTSQDKIDDRIVEALTARETELADYDNTVAMLEYSLEQETLTPEESDNLTKQLEKTKKQRRISELRYRAQRQLITKERLDAAIARQV